MGVLLALLMSVSALAACSAPAPPAKFGVRSTYLWPGLNSGRQMSAGQSIDWRGYVSPYLASSRVVIQYKVGSRWYDGARAKPYGSGYFRVLQRFNTPGVKTIRLRVYSGTNNYNTWTGNPINITVYGWHYLRDRTAVSSDYYTDEYEDATIDGTHYRKGLWLNLYYNGPARGAWNLDQKCTTFQATAGLMDFSSDTLKTAEMKVLGDGVLLDSALVTYRKKYPISVNISGARRLDLNADWWMEGGNYTVAWGDPRIRCSF